MHVLNRFLPTTLALGLSVAVGLMSPAAHANDQNLPELGSSADMVFPKADQAMYREGLLRKLRANDLLIEDPLVEAWLAEVSGKITAQIRDEEDPFTFIIMRQEAINAFATLGHLVSLNSGLILYAEHEDEVASVLAHEVSHVTQKHILRSVEKAKREAIPMMLATIAGAIAASQAGSGDAAQAVIAGGLGLMQQRQINYTRNNEHEADRVGIDLLIRSGYDPLAMADFFGKLQQRYRVEGIGAPDFLRTHPVTTTRVSEAKDRAQQAKKHEKHSIQWSAQRPNPLLPTNMQVAKQTNKHPPQNAFDFALVQERLRFLTETDRKKTINRLHALKQSSKMTDANRYGEVLLLQQQGKAKQAQPLIDSLLKKHPEHPWLLVEQADVLSMLGNQAASDKLYQQLSRKYEKWGVERLHAKALLQQDTPAAGRKARDILRPIMTDYAGHAAVQKAFARANELAGDDIRAGEAYAEVALLTGDPSDAMNLLQRLLDRRDLDRYQRARIQARMEQIAPFMMILDEEENRSKTRKKVQQNQVFSHQHPHKHF